MTSIERTAYPRFKRLITAHELHLFFAPSRDEAEWAAARTDCDEHLLAQLLALKSYQRMLDEIPETVVDCVRRAVDLPEGTVPKAANRTAERQRTAVRQRTGLSYDKARARKIAEAVMRSEAVSKNRPADLINIALEKVVEAGLELPGFTTLDALAAKVRTEVNAAICMGIYDQLSEAHRERLLALLWEKDTSGTTRYSRLKQSAKAPTWSHFRAQAEHLGWVDELGETGVWLSGVASGKITDFAGETDAADAPGMRDYNLVKRLALLVCLVHKARMRARDDLTTMFCKRIALQVKRAKAELEQIREQQQAIVAALIGNYRTVLQHIDADSPVQAAREKAAALTAEILTAVGELDQDAAPDAVAARLGDGLAPALHTMAKALRVQAGALGVPAAAVDDFGGGSRPYDDSVRSPR
ncbi:DUF4158 domain-containing protein [Streptomyces sp. KS 21]|uniref:DUF4158 domain-containing protein n=1 Tax=Streptomyces sp. KS 21 TaxID=2485150 RepID=UPI001062E869|nr:DUF4158 domain-containing protein [Streptomyces sp. KS 21]TDU73477.1 uncharacterized protein DUF4158 [Streptomyces sp. KS 21]TDU80698.1 uncharacterized protein DUF4158 [Streptomyces sp. KS 21]